MAEPTSPLAGVAGTALGVARARARESSRPDRLFSDPLAAAFVEASGSTPVPDLDALSPDALRSVIAMYHWIVARTRYLDDLCSAAVEDGIDQVVILGAGLDTRGFRLGWPHAVDLYEVDRSDIFDFKEPALADAVPTCHRQVVSADLESDWLTTLVDAGFDPNRRTLWLAEGLLSYLSADRIRRLLTTITEVAPVGSVFGITTRSKEQTALLRSDDPFATIRELWQPSEGFDVVDWMNANGWDCAVTDPREILRRAGRIEAEQVDGDVDQRVGIPRLTRSVRLRIEAN